MDLLCADSLYDFVVQLVECYRLVVDFLRTCGFAVQFVDVYRVIKYRQQVKKSKNQNTSEINHMPADVRTPCLNAVTLVLLFAGVF